MRGIGIVKTSFGLVSGTEKNGITCFKGVPYAKPPVGELRWKLPVPPDCWDGVLPCDHFKDMCTQDEPRLRGKFSMSEDCLYMNIWTPAKSSSDKLPVFFWIHGGAFRCGTANDELYHGWSMAAKNIVVVNISFRIGVFGFLAHPELSAENNEKISGNYGLYDILLGLEWVKKNIAAFGGDPNRVTICGQSSGGETVTDLLVSPLTSGLISGAIIMAGGPGDDYSCRAGYSLEEAEAYGEEFMDFSGCKNIDEMRRLSDVELLNLGVPGKVKGYGPFRHIKDGVLLPLHVFESVLHGKVNKIPVIIGNNIDEGHFGFFGYTDEEFKAFVKEYAGDRYEDFEKLYPMDEQHFSDSRNKANYDNEFAALRFTARVLEKFSPAPVYHYHFGERTYTTDGSRMPAYHSAELFFVFNRPDLQGWGKWFPVIEPKHIKLAQNMESYWANFIKTGDPNGPGLPEWPAYSSDTDQYLYIDSDRIEAQPSSAAPEIKLLASLLERHYLIT